MDGERSLGRGSWEGADWVGVVSIVSFVCLVEILRKMVSSVGEVDQRTCQVMGESLINVLVDCAQLAVFWGRRILDTTVIKYSFNRSS